MGMHLVQYPKADTLDFMWQGYDVRMFLGLKFLVSIFGVKLDLSRDFLGIKN